jgi:antitoxin component YwqK of YwqJK toxin-antitoxin module
MQYQYTIRTAEWRDNEAALMELVIGKVIDPKQQERISTPEFIEEHSQSRFASNTYQLMQTTTTDIYEPFDEGDEYSYDHMLPILTTKPESALDSSAVRFFEEQIRKNECPVILLFHAFCEGEYWNVPHLLLDGHHKFKAYQNLGVVPKTAIITRIFSADSVRFTPDQLIDHLYTWQSMYVFRSTLFNDVQIKKMRENPESKVHEFILNGLVRTYHDNGQLEHEATYEYNRIEGTARGWYKNGQLEYENTSVDGLEFVKKRRYYESGSLQEEILRDEPGKGRYTKTVWYESGAKNVEADFHMGKYVEILPMRIWFENGQLQKEFIGDDHKNYEARIWNEEGEILEHFTIVNGVQNWMVKPPEVPVRSKAIEQSDPKKKSFDYRLFWIILIFVVVIANVILFFIGM